MTRRLLGLVTIVITAVVGVVALPAVAPVAAAPVGFELEVPQGEGILQIRDADEAQELNETTITGTVDDVTGEISGATLETAPIQFDTVALGFPVEVTATFSQVTPGTGSGLVSATPPAVTEGDQPGQVTLRDTVKVDLDLDIYDKPGGSVILEAHCVTPPVSLELDSTTPYTESGGGEIVDADFTVPPVPTTNECIKQVADGVNELLAGPGHSLSLYIEGNLPVPPIKPTTTTTLSVDPSDGSLRGTDVTLTATVTEDEPRDADPTGTVVFRDGAQTLGSAPLQPDGTASLTTSALRPGSRSLKAIYQGDVVFAPSESAAVPYDVAPAPILTGTFPEFLTQGAPPVEFDLTIDNVGSPRPITNARVDVGMLGLDLGDIILERQLPDSTWVPVPLVFMPEGGIEGTLGPDDGAVVPAGAIQTFHLRVAAASDAQVKDWTFQADLVTVDPDTGDDGPIVASTTWPFNIVQAARTPTTTFLNVYDQALRPGQQLYLDVSVTSTTGAATHGDVEFLIDGRVVPFRLIGNFGPLPPLQTRTSINNNGSVIVKVDVPADLSTGPHIVTARYLGDTSYLPSTSQEHVLPIQDPLSSLYTCDFVSLFTVRTGAFVQASVKLPAYAKDGAELDLEDLEVTVVLGGLDTPSFLGFVATGGGFGVDDIEIDLGDAGTADGTSVEYVPGDYPSSDQFLHLQGLEGTIVVDGEPGEVMSLPIERIEMSGIEFLVESQFTFTCEPNDEPVVLDEVGVAGVSLVAETTTDPVRAGDDVVLTATAAPAAATGVIEFFAGSQSLGTASGATGTATLTVDDLPVGTNLVTARYVGVTGSPHQSNIVEVVVRRTPDCASFNGEGNGRAVRLVYLELLQRCPDQAGFDYWVGQLNSGVSREAFANTIAKTFEARMVFVDKAYRLMLDRPAEQAGKEFWAGRLATGRYDRLVADLGASEEFWNQAGGTDEGFVDLVYERLLERDPSAGDITYWAGRLASGESRRTLILTLFNLPEPLSKLVNNAYLDLLCRAATPTELSEGVALVRATSNLSRLYARIIDTDDFFSRAQAMPNADDC